MSQTSIEPVYYYLNDAPELIGNTTLLWYQGCLEVGLRTGDGCFVFWKIWGSGNLTITAALWRRAQLKGKKSPEK